MIPNNCLTDTLYPMTADIYYSTETQDEYGTMNSVWNFDRTIKCSAVQVNSKNVASNLDPDILMKYNDYLYMRTTSDIRVSSNSTKYPITLILVTNISNSNGLSYWNEQVGAREGEPTLFEVRTVSPSIDPFQDINHYMIYLARSQDQGSEIS
jgi:hypothetical protein